MLKKIFLTLFVILILVIGALAILPMIYKDKLVAMAKQEIESNVNAHVNWSDMGLSAFKDFPSISLYVKKLAVVNDAPFKDDTLVKMNELVVSVNVMSLIKGKQLSIDAIKLDHPVIHVQVLKDGFANYNIMKPDTSKPQAGSKGDSYAVKLKKFVIKDAEIIYDDKESKFYAEVDSLNNKLSGNFGNNEFELTDNASTGPVTVRQGNLTYVNKVKFVLKLAMDIDQEHGKYVFKDNGVQLNDLKLAFKGSVAINKHKDMDIDLSFSAKEPDFRHFISLIPAVYTEDFKNVKTTGSVTLEGFAKGKYAGASYPAFGATLKVDNASFQYPGLPAAVTGIDIDVKAKNPGGSLDNTVVDIDKFAMNLAGDPFSLKLHVTSPMLDPTIDGSLSGKVNLDGVKNYYPLHGAELSGQINMDVAAKGRVKAVEEEKVDDFDASGTLEVTDLKYKSKDLPKSVHIQNLKMTFQPEKVTLDNFIARIGKSDFHATGQLDNLMHYIFGKAVLKGTLDLNSDLIDLDELLADNSPPANMATKAVDNKPRTTAAPEKTTVQVPAKPQASSSIAQVPENLDFTVNIEANRITYTGVDLDNVKGQLLIHEETVTLNGLQGNAFDGTLTIDGDYTTYKTETPKVDMKMKMDSVTIEKAIPKLASTMSLAPIVQSLKGVLSTVFTLKADLDKQMSPNFNTMVADGRVDVHHMQFSGNKTANTLAERMKMAELKMIKAKDFFTTIKIAEGKMFVKPFNITMDKINLTVYGSHSLTDTTDANYNVLMDAPADQGGDSTAKSGKGAKRVKYKIAVDGKNADPSVKQTGKDGVNDNDEQQKINDEQQKLTAEADSAQHHGETKVQADHDRRKEIGEKREQRKAEKLKEHADQKAKDQAAGQ